jgi:predicted DNA-binding transcriptional regulator YafY
MLDIKNKLKRQIEILGLCLSQNHPLPFSTFDLADMFHVEELTIKRDLQDLRSFGIDIHSEKKWGICISGTLENNRLMELIHQYSALSLSDEITDKSTSLMVSKLGEKALANMTTLQVCIEQHRVAIIDYEKEILELDFGREIKPVLIFQRDNYWRVLASNEDKLKQFHLNKILEARMSDKSFEAVPREKIEDVFKYSWRSWLGSEKYNIKLKFSPQWTNWLKPKQLMDDEKIIENEDDSVIFETIVNSLEEVASWIVSRGKGVVVIEPEELKQKVIRLAQETIENYKV